jgi:hypothetical protein
MDAAERHDEDKEIVDFVDLAEYCRERRKPRRAHRYRLVIEGQERIVHQHAMPVVGILDLVGKGPDEWILEAVYHGDEVVMLRDDEVVTFHERGIEEFRTKDRRHHHHQHQHHHDECCLNVIINSEPVQVAVQDCTLLSAVVAEVLDIAKPVGRPDDQWELKTEAGIVLDLSLSVHAANVECGSTLYLSLKTGAAGDAGSELLVDPSVSRAKFAEEIAAYRAIQGSMIKRGIWLVRAEFPEVFVVFGAPNCQGIPLVAFGAILDFANYDFRPPSVRIVNPFTQVPLKGAELPGWAHLLRSTPTSPTPAATPSNGPTMERYMQWQSPDEVPFLCHPGVREYHDHPAHTGDNWLLRRVSGEGTLHRIVDILFQYGSSKLVGLSISPLLSLPQP